MNPKLKIKIIFHFTIFTHLVASGQNMVLDIPNSTAPSGSNWCWAACTHMATQYYGNDTELCEIVEWARLYANPDRGDDNCCFFPDSCYGGLWISNIDEVLGSEGLDCTQDGVVSLSTLKSTINDYRPLLIQGHHDNGGWHTMIIKGYNDSYIHYNDGGNSYITLYYDAITYECMGTYLWRWESYTHILTDEHCPDELNLGDMIVSDADYVAQSNIIFSCEIGNSSNVSLKAGHGITFNSGFSIHLGSTLEANVRSHPCY